MFRDIQIIIVTIFVVVSSVGIKREYTGGKAQSDLGLLFLLKKHWPLTVVELTYGYQTGDVLDDLGFSLLKSIKHPIPS